MIKEVQWHTQGGVQGVLYHHCQERTSICLFSLTWRVSEVTASTSTYICSVFNHIPNCTKTSLLFQHCQKENRQASNRNQNRETKQINQKKKKKRRRKKKLFVFKHFKMFKNPPGEITKNSGVHTKLTWWFRENRKWPFCHTVGGATCRFFFKFALKLQEWCSRVQRLCLHDYPSHRVFNPWIMWGSCCWYLLSWNSGLVLGKGQEMDWTSGRFARRWLTQVLNSSATKLLSNG